MNIKTIFRHYQLSLFVVGCILYLSFAPASTFKRIPTFEYEDKLVHLLMYFGLTVILGYEYLRKQCEISFRDKIFIITCVLFPVFLGGAIEVLQPILSAGRSANITDWLADIAGALLALPLITIISKKLKK